MISTNPSPERLLLSLVMKLNVTIDYIDYIDYIYYIDYIDYFVY